MARQHEIVVELMKQNCIQILDGKKFGTLLGELLKMLRTADEEITTLHGYKQLNEELEKQLHRSKEENLKVLALNKVLYTKLESRTPDGFKERELCKLST